MPHLPPRCEGLTYECFFAPISNMDQFPVPVFVFEWMYEQAQLMSYGMMGGPNQASWTQEQIDWVLNYISLKVESFMSLPAGSGFFFPACWDHEILNKDDVWQISAIDDFTFMKTVSEWVHADTEDESHHLDLCSYMDCNPTCRANWD